MTTFIVIDYGNAVSSRVQANNAGHAMALYRRQCGTKLAPTSKHPDVPRLVPVAPNLGYDREAPGGFKGYAISPENQILCRSRFHPETAKWIRFQSRRGRSA